MGNSHPTPALHARSTHTTSRVRVIHLHDEGDRALCGVRIDAARTAALIAGDGISTKFDRPCAKCADIANKANMTASYLNARKRVIDVAGGRIDRMYERWESGEQETPGSPSVRDCLLIVAEVALAQRLPGVAFTTEGLDFNADLAWEKSSDNEDPDYERLQTGRGIAEWFVGVLEEV